MSTAESILWGVVSGVLTSLILFLIALVSGKIVIPWYQELRYQGIDLGDSWQYVWTTSTANYTIQMDLKQSAHLLKGNATLIKSGAGKHDYVQLFTVTGSTWEGYAILNLKSTTRKSLSFASALLRIKNRGATMQGKWNYRSASSEDVESEDISFERIT